MKKEIKTKSEPVDVLDNSEPNESPDMREMDVPETGKETHSCSFLFSL